MLLRVACVMVKARLTLSLDPDREGGHMTSSLPPQEGHMTSSLPPQEGHVTSSLPPLAAEMDTSTEEENSDTGVEGGKRWGGGGGGIGVVLFK